LVARPGTQWLVSPSAVPALLSLPADMPTSPALTRRGELDAEVDFDPYRAANIAKLVES